MTLNITKWMKVGPQRIGPLNRPSGTPAGVGWEMQTEEVPKWSRVAGREVFLGRAPPGQRPGGSVHAGQGWGALECKARVRLDGRVDPGPDQARRP